MRLRRSGVDFVLTECDLYLLGATPIAQTHSQCSGCCTDPVSCHLYRYPSFCMFLGFLCISLPPCRRSTQWWVRLKGKANICRLLAIAIWSWFEYFTTSSHSVWRSNENCAELLWSYMGLFATLSRMFWCSKDLLRISCQVQSIEKIRLFEMLKALFGRLVRLDREWVLGEREQWQVLRASFMFLPGL